MLNFVKNFNNKNVDYLGIGPLRYTPTKHSCGLASDGSIIEKSLDEILDLVKAAKYPLVIGGGVKTKDLKDLKKTGVNGFFVVSEIAVAENVRQRAEKMLEMWDGAND